jgi:ankyrin repeat protein
LHYAAYGGFRDCVVTLLEAGSNINALDSMSRTPLFIAIERKKIDAALCLISTQGINLELILTSKFITAEASRQNIEMSAILEEHLSRLRESELICDPISLAIMQGHLGIIRSIFDHNKVLALDLMRRQLTNLEHMYWSSASIAIVFGHASILRWLLSQQLVKADGSACGGTYLVSAVKSGNIECLQILLENGATWNTRKSSLDQDRLLESLGHATKRGDLDMMQYLIKSGADVNAQWVARDSRFLRSNTKGHKRSALHVAAAYDQADAAELLMNHGCNVDDTDSNGWTALMHAAYWGCASVAQVLVVYLANPWLKDRHGSTAQDFAIAQQYSRVTPTTKNGHSRIVDLIRRVV